MLEGREYPNFASLATSEVEGRDYSITALVRPESSVAVLAPHGGGIEPGTSDIARTIAGDDFSLYLFEGTKQTGQNSRLHITSRNFDEPKCLDLLRSCSVVVAVHGCRADGEKVFMGGLNSRLTACIEDHLRSGGLSVFSSAHDWLGQNPKNICNRGRLGAGVQIELTRALRDSKRDLIAGYVRSAIDEYIGR